MFERAPKPESFRFFDAIIGDSACTRDMCERALRVAATDATVLLRGESGTGKDLLAEAIHRCSGRKTGPYIAVNMAAVPEALVESEIFGHIKGSFTGAKDERQGRFEAADKGTLFIDEIGDLRLPSQAKLLRVLENREVTPVGGDTSKRVDVRVIAATNKPLERMIAERRFRDDLYYRLNVVSVPTPPLRERPEDIPVLIEHFLDDLAETYECAAPEIDDALLDFLLRYRWPGNVRQLRNCIESMFVLTRSERLTMDDLPEMLQNDSLLKKPDLEIPVGTTLEELERAAILSALRHHEGCRTRAARSLGISVRTLQRKLKRWGFSDAERRQPEPAPEFSSV